MSATGNLRALPVPQNKYINFSNNLRNNNEPLKTRLNPKSETKKNDQKITEKDKLKMQREIAEKWRNEKKDSNYLQKVGTYSKKDNQNSRSFLHKLRKSFVNSDNSNSNVRDLWLRNFNRNYYNRNRNIFEPEERADVWTGNGWITLLGEQARAYNEGRWNKID